MNWVKQKGMTDKQAATQMLHNARSFLTAANRLFEQRPIGGGRVEMPVVPAIVCLAFSVELSLKALFLLDNGKLADDKKYRLNVMFNGLAEETRNEGRELYKSNVDGGDLDALLNDSAQVFVQWRYVFESEGLSANPHGLSAAANVFASLLAARLDL